MAGRKPTVSDSEFLDLFAESEDPILTTAEVADAVGFESNTGANKRLKELEERDLVHSKRVGNGLAWWITDAGREYLENQS